ncbi:MAG: response regulator [Gemmatimonadetes bacterium]|nr:response regulator [Gemmatimonadota bacterium]
MTDKPVPRIRSFLRELKRRKVYQVGLVYVAVGAGLTQLADAVFPALLLPDWAFRLLIVLLLFGLPIALTLAWAFDVTPEGVKRTGPAPRAAARAKARLPAAEALGRRAEAPAGRPAPGLSGLAALRAAAAAAPRFAPPPAGPGMVRAPARGAEGVPAGAAPPGSAQAQAAEVPDPDRVKRASLAHLRHELRTPINAIIGYSEMLLEDTPAAGSQELLGDLEKIRAAGKQLLSLVDSILDPSRLADGGIERELEAYGAELRHDLRTPLNAIVGYAELLIESSRETGRDGMVPDLNRILEAARTLLALLDSVVGLSAPAAAPASSELSRASAIARQVLSKIRPVSRETAAAAEIHQGRLLVVDDNPLNRDLLSRQLARQGYTVATAENGRQALETLQAGDYDLVLLDIMMPEIDGIEVLRRMKQDEALRQTPVIMISSLDEMDSVVRCIEIGAADYLSKPFDPALLGARIGACLELKRARERERAHLERLAAEQRLVENLLLSVSPRPVAERLRRGETEIAEAFEEVSVLCAGLEGLTRLAARAGPAELVRRVNELFEAYEELADRYALETVHTEGHAYLLAAGLPTPRADHADAIAGLALQMAEATASVGARYPDPIRVSMGIHTGPVVAGMVGRGRIVYALWGDGVATARELAAHGVAGSIHVSAPSYARLRERFAFESRGVVEIPGKGQMRTYLLAGPALRPA